MADLKRETALKKVKALTVLDKLQNGQEASKQCRNIMKYEKTVVSVLTIFLCSCVKYILKKKNTL